ncbi:MULTISPECIES: thiamine diphosphokinase [unclassified Yoonia]|uniref:thiamine diphosphokinase n=1 Tax=unclassified Yoonia TaxID=2629118 RepID=UPI002AFF1B60|nr:MULTISPECIES: thiamine diphosphokinase [unclassified Yoonia]
MCNTECVTSDRTICLIGGGPVAEAAFAAVLPLIAGFVGVDGGADELLARDLIPKAVIGDLDSVSDAARARFVDCLWHIAEQDSTDFEKALTRVNAPQIIALGFTGGRMDHALSVLNVMARHPDRPVFLVDADDVSYLAPQGSSTITLPAGARVSLMPLADVRASVSGVRWPFTDWALHPTGRNSASNMAAGGPVRISAEGPLLVTLPLAHLVEAVTNGVRAG